MSRNIKLTGIDKKEITEEDFLTDYKEADIVGKVKVGEIGLYYKDFPRTFCIPLKDIDRIFTRINGCNSRMCCGQASFEYYRLIVVKAGKEIANIIFGEDESVLERAEALIQERRPEIKIGYIGS